jgi:hypothetical protein
LLLLYSLAQTEAMNVEKLHTLIEPSQLITQWGGPYDEMTQSFPMDALHPHPHASESAPQQ